MPQLPSKAEYTDLNGDECLEILHTRFYDLLHTLPELQARFALTRVKLRLEIVLEISGSNPPKKIYHDNLEILVTEPLLPGSEPVSSIHTLDAEADSFNNAPDQIREEHGLPIPRGIRGPTGFTETVYVEPEDEPAYQKPPTPIPASQLPANQASPTAKQIGRRVYASHVEQDYGSVVAGDRDGSEGPIVGADKIAESGSGVGGDHAPVQPDFRVNAYHGQEPDKKAAIVHDAVERGLKIDRELENQRQQQSQRPKETPKPRDRK